MNKLPPMNLLLTVESATRQRSFKLAAEELHITPSAVSHRIRTVEEAIGSPLFKRAGQGIEPTQSAEEIAGSVAKAVHSIQAVWDGIQKQTANRTLHISCMSQFASRFLLPKLHKFKDRHPNIDLELSNKREIVGLEQGDYDIVVHLAAKPDPGFWSEPLLQLSVLPIAALSIQETIFRDGMLYGPLLSFKAAPDGWSQLSKALDIPIHPEADVIFFGSMEAAAAAAENGVGIAIVPDWQAKSMSKDGRVKSLLDKPVSTELYYWLAVRSGEESYPVIAAFRKWLSLQL